MEKEKIRLRPILYSRNTYTSGAKDETKQMFLLKALEITQDPKKLKQMIGVKTVAEVYRTLDKLAMRKEYHEALARKGISFDFITEGIKNIASTGEKDGDRLKAYQTLLKSVGMDKYDEDGPGSSGTWEEALLKKIEEEKSGGDKLAGPDTYEIKEPEIPESEKQLEEDEADVAGTGSVYDTK